LDNLVSGPSFVPTVIAALHPSNKGSTLFLILSALYVVSLFHIFKKRIIDLSIPVSLLSFVDDSLFVS